MMIKESRKKIITKQTKSYDGFKVLFHQEKGYPIQKYTYTHRVECEIQIRWRLK